MLLKLTNLRVGLDNEQNLKAIVARKFNLNKDHIETVKILRRAVDARRKNNICLVYHLELAMNITDKAKEKLLDRYKELSAYAPKKAEEVIYGTEKLVDRPIVVGAGPCGLIAALELAKHGYKPLLLERGRRVEERVKDVNLFWSTGTFAENSNVQFGEGGAGTFSDGKLTTRINDPITEDILQAFVKAGAPKEILYEQKPHVGTDKLRAMVQGLRTEIKELGGEIKYDSLVKDLLLKDQQVIGVELADGTKIPSNAVIIACGHSARDTYKMLASKNVAMEAKAFAIGVRIEHEQAMIDKAQYGEYAGNDKLGVADYALVYHDRDLGRTAYSFCMCPGGKVVAAASEQGGVVTNGMSLHDRNSGVANSGLVVNVETSDFSSDVLGGVEFQRQYERLAYIAGENTYRAPAQNITSFLKGLEPSLKTAFKPTYEPGLVGYDLSKVLPNFVTTTLRNGIVNFDKKIHGFAGDGMLTGIETRTSAPVRILRQDNGESKSHNGLYPAGEGAGYAGGIMSAAVDGYHVAHNIIRKFQHL